MQGNTILLFLVICFGLTLTIMQGIVTAQDTTTLEVSEPNWDSPRTRELAKRACFDCHSNEVNWPWYTDLPIVGDIVKEDVEKGREDLNFSEWGLWEQEEAGEAAETIMDGSMPPEQYTFWHPEAQLTEEEKLELIEGLKKTLGTTEENGEEGESEDEEEGKSEDEEDNVGKEEEESEPEDKDDDVSKSEDKDNDVSESEDKDNGMGESEDEEDNDKGETEDKDDDDASESEDKEEENSVGESEDKDDDVSESEDKDEDEDDD